MTSSLDFEGELILDGVLLDKLETLTKKLQKATKKTDKATILLDAKNEIGENPLFFFLDFILDPQITTGISKAKINKRCESWMNFHTLSKISAYSWRSATPALTWLCQWQPVISTGMLHIKIF